MATKRMIPDWANDGATSYIPASYGDASVFSESGGAAGNELVTPESFWRKADPTNPRSRLMQRYDAAGNKIGDPAEWKGGTNLFGDINPDTAAALIALATTYGLSSVGAAGAAETAAAVEPASAGATNLFASAGNASGLLPAGEALSAGAASTGAAGLTAAETAMLSGGSNAATTFGGGLLDALGSKTGATLAGGLLGALAGKDTQTTQSSSKDPWGPAQPYLLDNLKTNAAMQQHYQANPFSQEQMAAYQGVMNANANGMANAPVMSGIANNFMQSNRGRMAAMPQFTQGTQAAPINWDAYKNIGLLKG